MSVEEIPDISGDKTLRVKSPSGNIIIGNKLIDPVIITLPPPSIVFDLAIEGAAGNAIKKINRILREEFGIEDGLTIDDFIMMLDKAEEVDNEEAILTLPQRYAC